MWLLLGSLWLLQGVLGDICGQNCINYDNLTDLANEMVRENFSKTVDKYTWNSGQELQELHNTTLFKSSILTEQIQSTSKVLDELTNNQINLTNLPLFDNNFVQESYEIPLLNYSSSLHNDLNSQKIDELTEKLAQIKPNNCSQLNLEEATFNRDLAPFSEQTLVVFENLENYTQSLKTISELQSQIEDLLKEIKFQQEENSRNQIEKFLEDLNSLSEGFDFKEITDQINKNRDEILKCVNHF